MVNAVTPPLAQHFGSPCDTSQYSQHQHAAAVHGITNAYGSIQHTIFVAPLPPTSLAQQIQAISHLLKRGTNPNNIVKYVEHFNIMLDSGNLNDLAIIAVLPAEDLAKMVVHVANTLVYSTSEAPSTFEPLPTAESSTTVKPPPAAKRESIDEGTAPRPQALKRPRTSRKGKEPVQPAVVRRGCPGNNWGCKPHEQRTRKYWDTRIGFFNHFDAEHLGECRVAGNRWQCPACERPSFGGDGHELKKHMWDDHWE
ncbi:hypothetical protein J4E90_010535 [Alternaria incomplexa]|uniref:uncharacterized protein n=1 Tax=Alternaria incomplexa TaxID=1187928 RepID=UPI00221F002B|nr:uncharacterized protein J4E90_010535 [Alternaria incomplexa]KAI4906461.1 hypothetical protein J4E90_010535 [Alternaria incomplexa]